MSSDRIADQLAIARIPLSDRVVIGCGNNPLAVRAKRGTDHSAGVSLQGLADCFARSDIPERTVSDTVHDARAIGAECCAIDAVLVVGDQFADGFTRCRIPKPDIGAVLRDRGDARAVFAQRSAIHCFPGLAREHDCSDIRALLRPYAGRLSRDAETTVLPSGAKLTRVIASS